MKNLSSRRNHHYQHFNHHHPNHYSDHYNYSYLYNNNSNTIYNNSSNKHSYYYHSTYNSKSNSLRNSVTHYLLLKSKSFLATSTTGSMGENRYPCIYCEPRPRRGLMICCERCGIWYHYKCIHNRWDLNVKRKQQLTTIVNYYCYPCRRANPSLKLKYHSPENIRGGLSLRNSKTTTATATTTTTTTTKNAKTNDDNCFSPCKDSPSPLLPPPTPTSVMDINHVDNETTLSTITKNSITTTKHHANRETTATVAATNGNKDAQDKDCYTNTTTSSGNKVMFKFKQRFAQKRKKEEDGDGSDGEALGGCATPAKTVARVVESPPTKAPSQPATATAPAAAAKAASPASLKPFLTL